MASIPANVVHGGNAAATFTDNSVQCPKPL
jgi:hypothetical protein